MKILTIFLFLITFNSCQIYQLVYQRELERRHYYKTYLNDSESDDFRMRNLLMLEINCDEHKAQDQICKMDFRKEFSKFSKYQHPKIKGLYSVPASYSNKAVMDYSGLVPGLYPFKNIRTRYYLICSRIYNITKDTKISAVELKAFSYDHFSQIIGKVETIQQNFGAVLNPFEAYLVCTEQPIRKPQNLGEFSFLISKYY